MNRPRLATALCLATLVALCATAGGQQRPPTPRVGYVFPAGGRLGTTVEVTVGGQYLQGVTAAIVSGTGVQATVANYTRPMNPREAQLLRDKLDAARKKLEADGVTVRPLRPALLLQYAKEAGVTDAEIRALMEFQRMRSDPKRQPNPQIQEKVTLQVAIDPQAPPGERELRLLTPLGLTNPLRFEVGQLTEVSETEPNDAVPDPCIGSTLPVVVNGQILPGDVDKFTFTARKGTRLVIAAAARELTPYLADAVPGWFQCCLTLRDAKGQEVAFADHFRFDPDPVICCVVPADGEYVLEVRDTIYRGREDFVYRVTLGEVPYVTGVFPLGAREGAPAALAVAGWNLPQQSLSLPASVPGAGTRSVCVQRAGIASNSVPVAVDSLPECSEKEPNDDVAHAQRIVLPIVVNGRIGHPGDADVFRIDGRAGQQVVAEVTARRLDSPLDSMLILTDAKGRQIAANDDWEDKGAGLITHQADSRIAVTLPSNGAYYLRLTDTETHGGAEYAYRLRISPPRPDFELRVVPSSISGRTGTRVPVTVYALRRDGYAGDIALELKGAPGFALNGGRMPPGVDQVRCTVVMPPFRTPTPVTLQMEGSASIQGRQVRHAAYPAEDMMQAFAYRHLVPAQEWLAVATGAGRGRFAPIPRLADDRPARIPAGGTAVVRVQGLASGPLAGALQLALNDPPEGLTIQKVETEPGALAVTLRADAAKAKPGTQGNLIVDAYREMTFQVAGSKQGVNRRRVPVDVLPAIPFEVVKGPAKVP